MRDFARILLAASLFTLSLRAHTVVWDHGYPGSMTLFFGGADGTISIVPVTGEPCVVKATATASGGLVSVQPNGTDTAVAVQLTVHVLRRPTGFSETTMVSGTWAATGVPPTYGNPPERCNGSGSISVQVTVFDVFSIPTPTTSNLLGGAFVGDPIWDNTGEVTQAEGADFDLGGPLPLRFGRYYASLLKDSGVTSALGNNWMHNFDLKLAVSGANATVTLFRGQSVAFRQSGGAWQLANPERTNYQLVVSGNGFKFLDPQRNLIYTFSGAGALTRVEDRNGNALTVTPGPSGPTSITDGVGRTLVLTYAGNKLAGVADQAGRNVSFSYTGDDLTGFTDPDGKRFAYSYTATGSKTSLMVSRTLPAGNTPVSHGFDASAKAVRETDSRGYSTTVAYDTPSAGAATTADPMNATTTHGYQDNNLAAYTDATGASSAFTYDSARRRTSTTDRLGDTTSIAYHDPSGFVSTYTDNLGSTSSYSYTAQNQGSFTFHNLTRVGYPDGASATLSYDASGNVTTLTDRAGKQWSFTYNPRGQVLTSINPARGVTTYSYNNDGTLASVRLNSSDTTTFTYDAKKRLSQITQPDGKLRQFSYDNRDHLLSSTDELGKTASFSFNDNGQLGAATDPSSRTTILGYDGDERLASIVDQMGKTTILGFNQNGLLQTVTDPTGAALNYGYNSQNRLTSLTDATGKGVALAYDAEGVLSSAVDALSNTWSYTSDKLGRMTGVTTPLGESSSVVYDKLGRITGITNPLGQSSGYGYDSRGLLTGVMLPAGISASYQRNDLGQISTVTDPNGRAWSRAYDPQGRLVSMADPLARATSYSYDSRQRVSRMALPVGSLQLTYDDAGNLVRRLYGDGTDLGYRYDSNNRMTAANGISLGYDARGSIVSSNGLAIGRDDAGRISAITYGPGKTVTYTYDNRGLLVRVADWVGGTTDLGYDDAARLVSLSRPNGVGTAFTYDNNGRLAGVADSGGGVASSVTLSRDAAGQITSANRNVPLAADPPGGSLALAYDAAHQVQGSSYDAGGRLTGDAFRNYSWNQASQLLSYTGVDGAASFTYDGLGMRVSSTSGGASSSYAIDYALGLPSVSVVRTGGSDMRYYVYLPNGTLLHSIEAADGARHFYHFDEMGSTMFLTDDGAAITDTYGFSPYGEAAGRSGNTDNPFTFMGAYGVMQEGSTGLYYMRARFYDSTSARFLNPDPVRSLEPKQVNPYQYASANPLRYIDPLGLEPSFGGYGTGRPNIFQGRIGSIQNAGQYNAVTWNGVPLDPPGAPRREGGKPGAAPGIGEGLSGAGIANAGTRLALSFSNIPSGAGVWLPPVIYLFRQGSPYTSFSLPDPTSRSGGSALTPAGAGNTGVMVLTSTDSAGAGGFLRTNSSTTSPFALVKTNGLSVYEILYTDPFSLELADIPTIVAYQANVSQNLPAPSVTGQVTGGFAPVFTNQLGLDTGLNIPIPKFNLVLPLEEGSGAPAYPNRNLDVM